MSAAQAEVLVFVEGQEVARHLLGIGAHVFGSGEDCQVCIASPRVSRHHARLSVRENGGLFLEDLESAAGTFLDGVRIRALTPVTPNQSIGIGNATLLIQQSVANAGNSDGTPPELSATRRYEPGPEIAKGGMGAVHSARQPAIRREVAMKVMLRERSVHDRLRFIEEAQITGQLEHPNIVPVHELAVNERGRPYYTMKLVQGRTLKDVLKLLAQGDTATAAKYPLAALLTIFQKVCDAVAFAHAKGVIHRDLKPGNIMIADYGEVLLMDWGLAKVMKDGERACPEPVEGMKEEGLARAPTSPIPDRHFGGTLPVQDELPTVESDSNPAHDATETSTGNGGRPTGADGNSASASGMEAPPPRAFAPVRTIRDDQQETFATRDGAVMGTPQYMSPEQARGEVATLDERSDIFSLGAILYECVTLSPAFPGKTTADILARIRSGSLELPSARLRSAHAQRPQHLPRAAIPDSLEAVILKALALERAQRYQSVAEFQADITAYQNGFATRAEHAGPWKQFTFFVARNKAPVLSVAAGLVILSAVAASYTWRLKIERDLKGLANEHLKEDSYVSSTSRAFQAYNDGLPESTRILLGDSAAGGGEQDRRGFEWYYLKGLTQADRLRVVAHESGVNGLSLSPDKTQIATIGEDGEVAIWETRSFKETARWRAYGGGGLRVAWDFSGQRLATASRDGVVRVWDLETHDQVAQYTAPKAETGNPVETIAWEPVASDNARLAIGGRAYHYRYGILTVRMVALISVPVPAQAEADIYFWKPAEDPDGKSLEVLRNPDSHGTASLTWSSDGRYLGAGLFDGNPAIEIFDMATRKPIFREKAPSGSDIYAVAFNPAGDKLAAGAKHLYVSAYEFDKLEPLTFTLPIFQPLIPLINWALPAQPAFAKPVHHGFVSCVAWQPEGEAIASGSYDQTIVVSEVNGKNRLRVFAGHLGEIHGLAWARVPGCQYSVIFSCGSDGTLRAWQPENAERSRLAFPIGWISEVRWSPDASRLAVSVFSDRFRLLIYDRDTPIDGNTIKVPLLEVPESKPFDVAWSPEGRRLAIAQMHNAGYIRVIDALSGKNLAVFEQSRVRRVSWHPGGRYLAGASHDGVAIWDTQKNGDEPVKSHKPVRLIPREAARVAWNRDGRRLAIGTYDGALEIWDGLKGERLAKLRDPLPPIPGEVYDQNEPLRAIADLAWDPLGDRVAFVTQQGEAKIVDAWTGAKRQEFFGHTGGIWCMTWSPDGHRIATGGADGTLRLFDVANGNELVRLPRGTGKNEVSAVDWCPDGKVLASGGFDGIVAVWDMRRGKDLEEMDRLWEGAKSHSLDRAQTLHLALLCARYGWASRARSLLEPIEARDPAHKIPQVRTEIEATLEASLAK